MPYKIKQNTAGCKGFAVVNDKGELKGCHPSKSRATAHLKALYANVVEKSDPCWEGYEQVGWKTKDGQRVPNCVPKVKKGIFGRGK